MDRWIGRVNLFGLREPVDGTWEWSIVEANEREFSSITVVRMLLVLVIKRIVSLVRVSKYRRLLYRYGKLNF